MKSTADIIRQWLTLISIFTAFITNILGNAFPVKGISVGQISNDLFQNVLIIPANYAFAIWGIVYLGLISLAIYQALPSQRQNPYFKRIDYFLVLASLAQIVWVFIFQQLLFPLSLGAMLIILFSLIAAYLGLGIGVNPTNRSMRWFAHYPVSIYLGWISVATIVNVAVVLYDLGWDAWGINYQIWTLIMLTVAFLLGAFVIQNRRDLIFPSVFIWAFVAIAFRNFDNLTVAAVAIIEAIILFILLQREKSQLTTQIDK